MIYINFQKTYGSFRDGRRHSGICVVFHYCYDHISHIILTLCVFTVRAILTTAQHSFRERGDKSSGAKTCVSNMPAGALKSQLEGKLEMMGSAQYAGFAHYNNGKACLHVWYLYWFIFVSISLKCRAHFTQYKCCYC